MLYYPSRCCIIYIVTEKEAAQMIKFGVIGTGWIAEEFVKGTQLENELEFTAVYSRKN